MIKARFKMKRQLLIAGGAGLIGSALHLEALKRDWEVTILSRNPGKGRIVWDPEKLSMNISGNLQFDALVNLAGAPINARWNEANRKAIYESRIRSTRTIENYLFDGRIHTNVYLGASAIGIYGNRDNEIITEKTSIPKKSDWFVNTVDDWEKEHQRIAELDIRTVITRTGIVLSHRGGAMKELLQTSRFGFLPFFGRGDQVWPWIHIDDLIRMFFYFIEDPKLNGVYLATAPEPLSNKEFTKAVAISFHVPKLLIGVPKIALSVMLGKMHRVLLDSCNAKPGRIMQSGFKFRFATIQEAAKDIIEKTKSE